MSRRQAPLLLLFLALVLTLPPGTSGSPLSVEDAVRAALAANPDLVAARERVNQARSRLDAARAALAPHLGLDLGYLRGDAPSAYLFKRIDARELPSGLDFNHPGGFTNVEAGLTLTIPLWDAGRAFHGRRAAARGLDAVGSERDAVANELIGTTIAAYFDVLATMEFVTVAERSLASVQAQLEELRIRHRHGGALRTDVLGLEVRESSASERLIAARNGVALAEAALRRLLDLPPATPVRLTGDEWAPATLPDTLDDCLTAARENRPELAALDHALAAASDTEAGERARLRPRLDMVARGWADDGGGNLEADRANWTVGAQVSWELADGGLRRTGVAQARSRRDESIAQRRSAERAIELQVHQAFLSLQEARARHDVSVANVERAEESLDLTRRQFEGGSVTVTQYLQTETDRTDARVREIRGRYDIKKATAALGHALGLCWRCAAGWKE